ncbi:MAG: aspartyl protease family protein [Gammaproteobacteria bacterium]|nr:aspartyl protease family protein [Gammaproteobacteria bacterium]
MTPVLVNGSGPHSFVVDTGAESCAVYPHFAERQGPGKNR